MINQIIKTLNQDGVVALPTETVYGLAVRADSEKAIQKLMRLKDRDFGSGKVFTLVPESKFAIAKYAIVADAANDLIQKYIPGEITLILPKNPDYQNSYFDHFETIGIRIPDHEIFKEILPQTGALLLTSANPRGEKAAISSDELQISADYIEPGISGNQLPSTIVDLTTSKPKIIRQGRLSVDKAQKCAKLK